MDDQVLDSGIDYSEEEASPRFAGFWIRVGASFIDFLVYSPLIAFNFYNLYSLKSLALQLVVALLMIAYKPFLEYKYGATVGKMAVDIKVVTIGLTKISFNQAILRYLPWLIGQVLSLFMTVLLFSHPDFSSTTDFMVVSALQQEVLPTAYSIVGSALLLASCLTVAFNNKRQGIHDMIAQTYCIYK